MWYRVKFVIDEKGRRFSMKHVDLAVLDLIISQVLDTYQDGIKLWRIHRRYGQHELLFEAFCTDNICGQDIQNTILSHPFSISLTSNNVALSINPSLGPQNITDICEPAWPDSFREVWPEFAQQQSKLQLGITQYLRSNTTNSPTVQTIQAMPIVDILSFYESVQQQLDKSWHDIGSHTFIHHMHSFFAYQPFVSNVATQQLIMDIR